MYWVYDISAANVALLFAAAFVGFTWLGIVFVKPFLRLLLGRQAGVNDLVGFILGGHCAFFGLLLGLLAVAAYQNLSDVDKTVSREAGFLRSIYRSVTDYPEPLRSQALPLIREYTRYVVEDAWPQQRRGIVDGRGVSRMNELQAKLFAFEPQTKAQEVIHTLTMSQFFEMAEVRRARIQSVDAGVPAMMWYVVAVGTLITVVLVWMLDMRFVPHLLLSGLLMLFLSTVICLIVIMDKPLRGEISISADAYKAVLDRMALPPGDRNAGSLTGDPLMAKFEILELEGMRFVQITLENETVQAEAGALSYIIGNIAMDVRLPSVARMVKSYLSEEAHVRPTYTGTGIVCLESSFGGFHVFDPRGSTWLIDSGSYWASEGTVDIGAVREKAWTSFWAGEGFIDWQTRISGHGQVVLTSPGPVEEITLEKGKPFLDNGRCVIGRTKDVAYKIVRPTKSIIRSYASGEGHCRSYDGPGRLLVCYAPHWRFRLFGTQPDAVRGATAM